VFIVAAAVASMAAPRVVAEGTSNEDMQRAQVERLRLEMTNTLHLKAYDLVDELVYGWTQAPPFATDTAVVVGDVVVPYGFGSGLEALVENHLTGLLTKHTETHVRLAHCPACHALTVRSTAKGTTIARGIDQPEALRDAGVAVSARHALFLDFEAEGAALVLRARLTTLDDDLTIVGARTLSSSTSSAALLRAGDTLVSAEAAQKQYLDALTQRGPLTVPLRLAVVQFSPPSEDPETGAPAGIGTVPLLWLQVGAEMGINHARAWTGTFTVGGTWLPQLYSGFMGEVRVSRLLTGAAASLTQPNLYAFLGGSLVTLFGPSALLLRDDAPNLADLIAASTGVSTPMTVYPALSLGLDLRIGNRVGAGLFVQTAPTLASSPSIGRYLDFGLVQVHAIGGEVTLCF
jgi:hypothetical protein